MKLQVIAFLALVGLAIIFSPLLLMLYVYTIQKKGSQHSWLYALFKIGKPIYTINGTVKPGFEKVKEQFELQFKDGMERNSQCCAYYRGEKVVDLWGSFYDSEIDMKKKQQNNEVYNENSTQMVFSSSKVIESLVVALLYDKGLIRYQDKICKYWPEFAKNGKEDITIEDLMRHEAGLHDFNVDITLDMITPESIKKNVIGKIIEDQKPYSRFSITKSKIRRYHAITRGFITNELVRRVDPKGRTVGEFIQEELSLPLNADFYLGVKKEELENNFPVVTTNKVWAFFQSWKYWGRSYVKMGFMPYMTLLAFFPENMRKGLSYNFNSPELLQGEAPSVNGLASARGLAKLGLIMSSLGKIEGKQFMDPSSVYEAISKPTQKFDRILFLLSTYFCKGGWNVGPDFIGWEGYGGSICYFSPELKYSFSYAMNLLEADMTCVRGKNLHAKYMQCINEIEGEQ